LTKHYPHAEKIVLVMDNPNTHTIASLYEAFSAGEALGMARRLEVHFTPKHGSWLNMAEIELSALTSQCLNRPDRQYSKAEERDSGMAARPEQE
jgi:transposase